MLALGSKMGQSRNLVLEELKRMPGFLDRLETLQYHEDQDIYREVVKVLERFFPL
jgi:hypothetical protein